MIFFFESGQLGNQLFQYCAMRRLQPDAHLVVAGMDALRSAFEGIRLVEPRGWGRLLLSLCHRVGAQRMERAARWRWLTLAEEIHTGRGAEFKLTPGLLRGLVYFKPGYYQAENMVDAAVTAPLALKEEVTAPGRALLRGLACDSKDLFFVHVRRGDYFSWPSREAPAVLPGAWYKEQMERLRAANPNAWFVIVTDDRPYAEEVFGAESRLSIFSCDMRTDFAIMTLCLGGGILSASTFSWWAAYFARRSSRQAKFIAPHFWGGFRSGHWYPPSIQTSWLTYAPVLCPGQAPEPAVPTDSAQDDR